MLDAHPARQRHNAPDRGLLHDRLGKVLRSGEWVKARGVIPANSPAGAPRSGF